MSFPRLNKVVRKLDFLELFPYLFPQQRKSTAPVVKVVGAGRNGEALKDAARLCFEQARGRSCIVLEGHADTMDIVFWWPRHICKRNEDPMRPGYVEARKSDVNC